MQTMKQFALLLTVLFLLPLIIGQLPFPNNAVMTPIKQEQQYVYASHLPMATMQAEPYIEPKLHALMLFTHSHEAYKPVVAQKTGVQAVYHEQTNIFSMQQSIKEIFLQNAIDITFLQEDIMKEMKSASAVFSDAYKVARPYIEKQLSAGTYDIIIDFHRDAVGKQATTLQVGDEKFAKVSFIVGAMHPQYQANLFYAETVSTEMNKLVPNISRGVFQKSGAGVNGIYNQDLAGNMLLIELGGIENTEEELLQTLNIIARALANSLASEQL